MFRLPALWMVAVCGCASEASQATASGSADPVGLVGDFAVRLTAQNPATGTPARTNVLGVVKDGQEPEAVIWRTTAQSGACSLLEPETPFCEQGCGGVGVCTSEDQCTPYPMARPVGLVRLTGLGGRELEMEPIAGKYMPAESLPYPPCSEGSELRLDAAGGAYPAFALSARCIAPLAFEPVARLEPGVDLQLNWTAPAQPELARIEVKVDVSHHGGAKGKIECDADDSGRLTVDGALVAGLIELGVAGFPTITLTRVMRSAAQREPRQVTLRILEAVERPLDVPGVASCTEDTQCPGGQKCASNLLCQPD